jgi:LmbE family N-acetylglucosaminyl deacetylase
MNVLVIAPHPDDETIGCGGALYLHAQRGDRVQVVYLTSGELGLKHLTRERAWRVREREAKTAAKILGIQGCHFLRLADWQVGDAVRAGARALSPVLRTVAPQMIYVPHRGDWHPDHQAAQDVLCSAVKRVRASVRMAVLEIRAYEVWTPLAVYDHVEDISRVMATKVKALRAHRSQLEEFKYERAMRGLNAFRGELTAKCRYAEVFQTLSWEGLQ